MKTKQIIYWIATGMLAVGMLLGALVPLIDNSHAVEEYTKLGYPTYLITFISIAKILAVVVILHHRYKRLVEWAYAGLFYDFFGFYGALHGRRWGTLDGFTPHAISLCPTA